MTRRKLKIFDRYHYGPRSVLMKGDQFRVQGGPIYISGAGARIPMYERGTFLFDRYCEQGAARWIEAFRSDGGGRVVLWVGRTTRSKVVPGLMRRPYRITRKLKPAAKQRKR